MPDPVMQIENLFKFGFFKQTPIMIGDTANEERMFIFYYSEPLSKQDYIDYLLYIARDKGLLVRFLSLCCYYYC